MPPLTFQRKKSAGVSDSTFVMSQCAARNFFGTKSVLCILPFAFYPAFDYWKRGSTSNLNAQPRGRSFWPATQYLKLTITRTGWPVTGLGKAAAQTFQYDPNTGVCSATTNGSPDGSYPYENFSFAYTSVFNTDYSPGFLEDYIGGNPAAVVVKTISPTKVFLSSAGGSTGYVSGYAGTCTLELSMPYTLTDATANAVTLLGGVSLLVPSNYTLSSGGVVTFDYFGRPKLAGASAVAAGLIANANGTFSLIESGRRSYQQIYGNFNRNGFAGTVAMMGVPMDKKYDDDGSAPDVWPFKRFAYLQGGFSENLLRADRLFARWLIYLKSAVSACPSYAIKASAVAQPDVQPFNVPLFTPPITNVNELPAVIPASVNLVAQTATNYGTRLIGETIFNITDAPPAGVLGVTSDKYTAPNPGAGQPNFTAGSPDTNQDI